MCAAMSVRLSPSCCAALRYAVLCCAVLYLPSVSFVLKACSIWLQSTQALPFGTIVVILVIWALVTIPLCILGGIMGKNNRSVYYL